MKADTITKDYISDTTIFADVFNYYIYGGKQVIQPEQLVERDSTEIALPYGADGATTPIQKFRDVQKLYTAMTDGDIEYILYGIESQTNVHYAAPVKNILYDVIEYASQVEESARSHRKAMKQNPEQEKPSSGEFLSGFWKTDRLIPSITVMLYFGSDQWDGPLSLFDMLEVKNPEILYFLDNYRVKLIAPAQMSDEEIMKFQSSLREVLLFIKYSKDKENLDRILKANEIRFREVERRAVDVIKAVTNVDLQYKESEVEVDMCQAWRDMQVDCEAQGILKQAAKDARVFYKLGMGVDEIAQNVGCDVEIVKEWVIYPNDAQTQGDFYNLGQEIKERGKMERDIEYIVNMHRNGFTMEQIAKVSQKTIGEVKKILEKKS